MACTAAATLAALTLPVAASATTTPNQDDRAKLVRVQAPTQVKRAALERLGLDVTPNVGADGVDVIVHGSADEARLRSAGYTWKVKDGDLSATVRRNAAADKAYAASTARSPLPSGSTAYRTLAEVNAEILRLERRYPVLVRSFTLPLRSVEGRPVRGFEIAANARNTSDGKPVFLMMGAHHAREWPTVDHTMEFAWDLLKGYGKDRRATRIVRNERIVFIPVVNVDGFDISRSAEAKGDFSRFDYEMKRKNCSVSQATPAEYRTGTCADNPAGRLRGTDLNRNYPGFWGGEGASPTWSSDTFRGDGPGSEPEVENIRRFMSSRQVTHMITNHTYSNLVLRPPSNVSTGYTPDEPMYKALGESMTAANGYANQTSFQLYPTSGSTEDWSYWNTGGFGFTFEISPDGFHEPYEKAVVGEYLGLPGTAGAGKGGNREAYYRMAEHALTAESHSLITGRAPEGRVLRVTKSFTSLTSPVLRADGTAGEPVPYTDHLESTYRSRGGAFTWHVNPSTRPAVAGRWGRDPQAPAQPTTPLTNPAGIPAKGASESTTFTIQGMPTYDNFKAEVKVAWPDASQDWDVYVYDAAGNLVGSAASLADPEVALLIEPVPGTYTVVVENYSGGESDWSGEVVFSGPDPRVDTGVKEAWNLTCTRTDGTVLNARQVVVDRGQKVDVGAVCVKPSAAKKR